MFCSACGKQNDDDARFCTACGKPQTPSHTPPQNISAPVPPESPQSAIPIAQPGAESPQSAIPIAQTGAPPPRRSLRSRILKWGGIGCGGLIAIFVILLVIGIVAGNGDDGETSSTAPAAESTSPAATMAPTPTRPAATFTPAPTPNFEALKSESASLTYDDLFRNNERHIGKTVWYAAQIIQVQDSGSGRFVLRANVDQGEYIWDDSVYLHYSGPRLLEEDIIEFVGVVDGLMTYQAVLGNSVTIPEITVLAAKLLE